MTKHYTREQCDERELTVSRCMSRKTERLRNSKAVISEFEQH